MSAIVSEESRRDFPMVLQIIAPECLLEPRQSIRRPQCQRNLERIRQRSQVKGKFVQIVRMTKLFMLAVLGGLMCMEAQALAPVVSKALTAIINPLITHPQALPDDEIIRLAKMGSRTGGTKEIGSVLGSMKLPEAVIEDTYLRIAIQQSKISRSEAEGMMSRLRGVEGFRTTLRKVLGASGVKTSGHLNELRIADKAAENGFEIRGIGIPFSDPTKSAPTDIDILLQRNGKIFAIEAKDYRPDTMVPLDKFRADMVTLKEYAIANSSAHVIQVFSVSNKPSNELSRKILAKEARRRGIELIYGTPEEIVIQVKQLEKLL